MIRLEPMNDADFTASRGRAILRHAEDCVRRGLWAQESAVEASERTMREQLPQGRETPTRYFVNAVDEKTSSRVGEAWYSVEFAGGKTRFWVEWIWIDAQHRRRGHATEVLRRLADEAARQGADRIGLHVFSDNEGALALYTKVGYAPTSVNMAKPLKASSDAGGSAVAALRVRARGRRTEAP